MKKTFLLLTLFAFAFAVQSCGDDDNTENPNGKNEYFNPPEWIQGSWKVETSAPSAFGNHTTFIFTKDDFISVIGSAQTSNKYQMEQAKIVYDKVQVDEVITDSEYHFKMIMGGHSIGYKFNRINNNKIEWINQYTSQYYRFYYIRE